MAVITVKDITIIIITKVIKILAKSILELLSAKSAIYNMTLIKYLKKNSIMSKVEKESCFDIMMIKQ